MRHNNVAAGQWATIIGSGPLFALGKTKQRKESLGGSAFKSTSAAERQMVALVHSS